MVGVVRDGGEGVLEVAQRFVAIAFEAGTGKSSSHLLGLDASQGTTSVASRRRDLKSHLVCGQRKHVGKLVNFLLGDKKITKMGFVSACFS